MVNSEFEKDGLKPSRTLKLTPLRAASGGTCNAYETRLFGKKVFVKEIKPEFADDPRMLAAFRKEAEIGFRLEHSNLPTYIYAEGVLPPERYIVQEFIDGRTLPDFIKGQPAYFQSRKNIERFIREFIDVIDYLHHNRIVHLDLKPENILISRVGTSLKLVDLGFCASDFYDDTRGFSPGELAPEGNLNPEERGVESDYYGIGKILSYIRENTPGFPQKRYRKLESRLLLPDPAKRLSSKEGIEKILAGKVREGRVWLAVASAFILSALVLLFIILFGVTDSQDVPADGAVENRNVPAVKETEANDMESMEWTGVGASKETHRETPDALQPREENPLPQTPEPNITPQREFSYDSYERLKAEITENINKNFAGFEKILTAYLRDGKFTEKDYKTVLDTYNSAMHKTFDTDSYKAQYKDLSSSLIDDTMAELMQEIEKKRWKPAYQEYIRQYQEVTGGSSR